MIIGVMVLDLFAESSTSLKDKRHIVASVKEKLRNKFNISIIESDFQDLWQRIQLSIVMVSNSRQLVDQVFLQIEEFILSSYPVQLLEIHKEYT
jgi:uncharacterized protein YlxP (DUF503 family)